MRLALFVAVALASAMGMATLAGCNRATQPLSAVNAYADAVEHGDYAAAYDLMSLEFKRRVSRDDFTKMLRESPGDVRTGAARLRAGARALEVHATYVYTDTGEELRLVEEDGHWRIDVNPLDFYPQDSPRGAMRSFIRAVELKRYDVLARLVPKGLAMTVQQLREQFEGPMAEEVAGIVKGLRAALDVQPVVNGDDASIVYGERKEIRFHREDGVWKIEDFD